jgi:hypothetical protein
MSIWVLEFYVLRAMVVFQQTTRRYIQAGRAIAQAISRRLPTAAARLRAQVRSYGTIWDLWWTKWHWGRFSPSTSVSHANSHSTKCSILVYHPGLVQ